MNLFWIWIWFDLKLNLKFYSEIEVDSKFQIETVDLIRHSIVFIMKQETDLDSYFHACMSVKYFLIYPATNQMFAAGCQHLRLDISTWSHISLENAGYLS